MDEPAHELVDDLVGVLLAFLGQVKVLHGGFETGMTEIALDDADIHSGFQEMSGVAMPEGMNGDARPDYSGGFFSPDKGSLHARSIHRDDSFGGLCAASPTSREDELWIARPTPI